MMTQFQGYFSQWEMPFHGAFLAGPWGGFLFSLLLIWSLVWKGMALWKSGRRGEKVWFVVLFLINTAGILDILYLYVFSKKAKPVE